MQVCALGHISFLRQSIALFCQALAAGKLVFSGIGKKGRLIAARRRAPGQPSACYERAGDGYGKPCHRPSLSDPTQIYPGARRRLTFTNRLPRRIALSEPVDLVLNAFMA